MFGLKAKLKELREKAEIIAARTANKVAKAVAKKTAAKIAEDVASKTAEDVAEESGFVAEQSAVIASQIVVGKVAETVATVFSNQVTERLKNVGQDVDNVFSDLLKEEEQDESDKENTDTDDVLRPEKPIDFVEPKQVDEELNYKLSDLNLRAFKTMQISPGMVVYTINKNEPTKTVPYPTFEPVARPVTRIHENGVDKGALFFSYKFKFLQKLNYGKEPEYEVIAEDDVIYSPLTLNQARYISMLLNVQAKQVYEENIKKVANTAQEKAR